VDYLKKSNNFFGLDSAALWQSTVLSMINALTLISRTETYC